MRKSGTEATNSAPLTGNPVVGAQTSTGAVAPSIAQITAATQSTSRLLSGGRDYIERLMKGLGNGFTVLTVNTIKIESRVIVNQASNTAVVLLFAETHNDYDGNPPSDCVGQVITTMRANEATKTIDVLQGIVVTKEDYALVENATAFIYNLFVAHDGVASSLTINQFKAHNIVVTTNISRVRDFVSKVSMHAVPARADIGFVLSYTNQGFQPMGNNEIEQVRFLACTGYTRFIMSDNSNGRYLPLVTITDIVSNIPNPQLLSLALPIASDYFITQRGWLAPYTSFAAGQPNLGGLVEDPTTRGPSFITDMSSLNRMCESILLPPILAIDLTDGRARPALLDHMAYRADESMAHFASFYPGLQFTGCKISTWSMFNHTGTVVDNGELKDSRCIDYLHIIGRLSPNSQAPAAAVGLLRTANRPNRMLEGIKELFPNDTKSLYGTNTLTLDAGFVRALAAGLQNSQVPLIYESMDNSIISVQPLLGVNASTDFSSISVQTRQNRSGYYGHQY